MNELAWKNLQSEMGVVFLAVQELKERDEGLGPIFKLPEFLRISDAYKSTYPRATNEAVLSSVLTHFSKVLKCV